MHSLPLKLLLLFGAYVIGSIPFGFLVGRLFGRIDIREHGSRNIGATNVGRVMGTKWGLLVLVLDLVKGVVPVAVVAPLLLRADAPDVLHWRVAAGVATILGHMFPCWLGFRGGKGVATSLGVVACLAPGATGVAFATFALKFAVSRIVSLASILASLAFALFDLASRFETLASANEWSLTAFSVLVPLLIVVRHRTNIVRLWRGEEPRFRGKGNNSAVAPNADQPPS
jgi:acyl phosphate:glycerol-3-phosphate acyltransferase